MHLQALYMEIQKTPTNEKNIIKPKIFMDIVK